jgi:hypothetical protein
MKTMTRTVVDSAGNKVITTELDVELLPFDDQVRTGFEKGTLLRATFELSFGATVVYELENTKEFDPVTTLRRNLDD